jgi:nucleotide-binding universal stress UspA family protein
MIRIKSILCPVDFSDVSHHALEHAVMLARWYHANLFVLHVHRLAMPVTGIGPYVPEVIPPVVLTDGERNQLLGTLKDLVAPARAGGVPVEILLDEALNVAQAVEERAHSLSADLITLGTHGRSGFQRLVLGSVAERVLRAARCPVMTVPAGEPVTTPRSPTALQRIICPIDFSPASSRAIEYAASLASQADARLTVMHVIELPMDPVDTAPPDFHDYRQRVVARTRERMAETVTERIRQTCEIDELFLVGRAYKEILRVAQDQFADLIVMGVQGRGAVDLMFFGSTTNHVVRQAACPVLTIRAV